MFWPVCKAIRLLWRLGELLNNRDFHHRLSPACPPHKPLPPLFHSATTAHHSALSPSTKSPATVQSPLYCDSMETSIHIGKQLHTTSLTLFLSMHMRARTLIHTHTHTQHAHTHNTKDIGIVSTGLSTNLGGAFIFLCVQYICMYYTWVVCAVAVSFWSTEICAIHEPSITSAACFHQSPGTGAGMVWSVTQTSFTPL